MFRSILVFLLLFVGWFLPVSLRAEAPFTVVLDAGHGGKDPGTRGASSREKDIVLSIALKVGELIKARQPSVKVIYTRNTDVYIELNKRADIANKAKANLFVSIHADHSDSRTVKGASTFTLGQNRTSENMAIAKRENSVILLEDNYKQRYEGFDPTSAESYIMFEFMQSNYMDQSIRFATNIQNQFKRDGRPDRGVRQDVFLVLRNTSMPSALIEVGFLSNPDDEQYLKSEAGQNEVANSIYRGFAEFKADYERKSTTSASLVKKTDNDDSESSPETIRTTNTREDTTKRRNEQTQQSEAGKGSGPEKNEEGILFKVQILVADHKLRSNDRMLKGQQPDFYIEKGLYKYTSGSFNTFEGADKLRASLNKNFPGCFVIAFKNDQKIPVETARIETRK